MYIAVQDGFDFATESKFKAHLFVHILNSGLSILNLDLGIVRKLDGSIYELVEISGIAVGFKSGDLLQIKSTYCRDVFASGKARCAYRD